MTLGVIVGMGIIFVISMLFTSIVRKSWEMVKDIAGLMEELDGL